MLLSFHPLFIGGNPMTASSIYGLVPFLEQVGGVHYARGGMHTVVAALVGVLERLGGRMEYGAPWRSCRSAPRHGPARAARGRGPGGGGGHGGRPDDGRPTWW